MAEKEQSQGTIKKQQKPFIMSPTHICRNNQISSVAYKLWNVIESKPENWEFFWYEILNHFKEGRNKVKKSLKELEKFGFVRKTRRKKGNLYCGMDFELFYDPTLPLIQENQGPARVTENGSIENGSHESGSAENGDAETRSAENGEINKDIIQEDGDSKKKVVKKNNSSFSSDQKNVLKEELKKYKEKEKYGCDFEEFWLTNESSGWTDKNGNEIKNKFTWLDRYEKKFKEKNPAAKKSSTPQEPEEIKQIRNEIKTIIAREGEMQDYLLFLGPIQKSGPGYKIIVEDERALRYEGVLKQIKVEVMKV